METNKEIELLKEKYIKLKRVSIVMLAIVFIGICGACFLGYIFFSKNATERKILIQETVPFKKKVQHKNMYGIEYFENYHNASYILDFYDGGKDMHATHPKIINFKDKWNGYKYWMVYSPYPYGNDEYENPYLVVSNDLINWKTPDGLTNPIEEKPSNYKHEYVYNSDPHIVYNEDTNELELYFRFVDDTNDKVIIYRRKSNDGINWTSKEEIISNVRSKVDYLSPAIIYDEGIYKMWYVGKDKNVYYMESNDGYNYSKPTKKELTFPIPTLKAWHLDAIKSDNGYELLVSAYKSHKDRNSMNLYHFLSKDNNKYGKGTIVMRPSISSWDNKGLYRSSFIYEDGMYYVLYSGISMNNERGIGLAYGQDINNLVGSSIKKKNN